MRRKLRRELPFYITVPYPMLISTFIWHIVNTHNIDVEMISQPIFLLERPMYKKLWTNDTQLSV